MKFLADECCDISMVNRLREQGHDVVYIQEEMPGISDSEVLQEAFLEKRILITEDKDFGELVYRLKKPAYGVILLRFHPLEKGDKIERVIELSCQYSSKMKGNLLVIDSEKIRIRPLQFHRA